MFYIFHQYAMEGARAMKAVVKMSRRLPENDAAARRLAVEVCPSVSVAATNAPSVTSTIDVPPITSSSQTPEEPRVIAGESLPRDKFGGLPTLQEAREATSELSRATQLFLASPNWVRCGDLGTAAEPPSSHLPTSAVQAFQLLIESPQVQNVVSSIVADPNVWNAVIKNQEFQELLQSHNALSKKFNHVAVTDTPSQSSPSKVDASSESCMDYLRNFKDVIVALMDWMIHFLELFQNLTEATRLPTNDDGSPRFDHSSNNLLKPIIGLVVMVITMILAKHDK